MTQPAEPPGYFTLAELRALPQMLDTVKYPDARALAARSYVESVIERVCRTSFIGRTVTAAVPNPYGRASLTLTLPDPYVLAVTGAALDGTPLAAPVVAGLTVASRNAGALGGPVLRPSTSWPGSGSLLSLTYLAGWSAVCPPDLKEAALQATRARLIGVDGTSGVPSRALSITNELGNVRMATAGQDAPFGIPDVDAVVVGYRELVEDPVLA